MSLNPEGDITVDYDKSIIRMGGVTFMSMRTILFQRKQIGICFEKLEMIFNGER